MEKKRKSTRPASLPMVLMLSTILLAATFQGCFSELSQPSATKKKSTQPRGAGRFGSSVVFPVVGNVYPLGYYAAHVNIGTPPKAYDLDIDTGSDLTWVQCDGPCTGCTKPRNSLYKPNNNLIPCGHSLCVAIQSSGSSHCDTPNEQCDFEVHYADQGSCFGVLLADYFSMRLMNGSLFAPRITFGCGYDLQNPGSIPPPSTAGVLGLGNGKVSIISQLQTLGVVRNVIGHCFSGRGGGFLFIGESLVPSSGVVWMPMSKNSPNKHYSSGPAELLFGGKPTGIKGLQLIFDSGSSYAYFNDQVYESTVNLIRKDINGKVLKDAPEEKALPICWKGTKPFKSVQDVKSYFKPLALSFTKAKNAQLQLSPEHYLIVTGKGNVCLGILNGTEVGLGNLNVIGDISFQDKMVIYDNEKQLIGWVPANCDRLPKS